MLIIDYRSNTIKEINADELLIIAPKSYTILKVDDNLGGVYEYRYEYKGKVLNFYISLEEYVSLKVPLQEVLSNFLENHNFSMANLTRVTLYVTKKRLKELREQYEE